MTRVRKFTVACCALLSFTEANAAALSDEQIERAIFTSMFLSPDYRVSQLGVRVLGKQFANDDSVCDYVAERLLHESNTPPPNADAVEAISWYANVLRDNCSPRYRDALSLARKRYTHEKIVKYLDAALAAPVTASVEQYPEGAVDLLRHESDIQQQLRSLGHSSGVPRGFSVGTSFGSVVRGAGLPLDLEPVTLHIARWGRSTTLVAHYRGGLLMFHRPEGKWVLYDTYRELAPVDASLAGRKFGIAQSLVCLRGDGFRVYIKEQAKEIRQDRDLLWALTNRLSRMPFPSDRYEEDGMLVALKLIVNSRHAESLNMLRQIAAAPGDKMTKDARAYVQKLERSAGWQQAEAQ